MIKLPITAVLEDVKNSLRSNSTLILQAPPGAGKSTMVPISLLEEPWLNEKMIIMLEPRRVAARMVATQMAKLLGEELGQRVGYQVKMDNLYTKKTKILVVTEAILVRMLQGDQTLAKVALIIFDEFHERNINSDLSLALSLQTQELLREDLKILIMSATLNSIEIANLLGDVPIITSEGKFFEVQNSYLDIKVKQPDFKNMNVVSHNAILHSMKNDVGDVLVFLPGVREIKKLQSSLAQVIKNESILLLPLYSALSKKEQDLALQVSSKRKIILSTNVAQTSLTIDGVRVVIDTGLEKLTRYNYANGMNHLELSFISKDSAIQRSGRAGRTSHGKCYRLWHESKILTQSTKPEILRSDLSSLLLDLAFWGVDNFSELKWLDTPNADVLQGSRKVLQELQMLDEGHKITDFGEDSLSLGLHPRFAHMILKANEMNYAYEACLVSALLSEKDVLKGIHKESDLLSRFSPLYNNDFDSPFINANAAREVLTQADFFYKKLKSVKEVSSKRSKLDESAIAMLLLLAYPDRLAKQRGANDAKYKLSNGKGAVLNIEDSLFNEQYLVVCTLNANERDSFINLALSISLNQIEEYFSRFIKKEQSVVFNKENKKFDIRENRYFLKLLLDSTPIQNNAKLDYKKMILELLKKEGLELLSWSKKAISLKQRVCFLNQCSEIKFENLSDEGLHSSLDIWLAPYLQGVTSIKELENLDMYAILLSTLSWENQQKLELLAPSSVEVPSGSKINIDYSDYTKPSISVKIQEMFGLTQTPKILNDSMPLQIQLLSPGMRPIQITYDLKSFWDNSYAEVRGELRGKYKRHYWPENPYEAVATSKTKKHMMKSLS